MRTEGLVPIPKCYVACEGELEEEAKVYWTSEGLHQGIQFINVQHQEQVK